VEEFFLLLGREDWIHLFVAWFKHYESQKLVCMIESKCPQLPSFIFGLFLILVRDGLFVRYTKKALLPVPSIVLTAENALSNSTEFEGSDGN